MSRMILDDDFREWEVYPTTGRHGVPEPARIVFRCRSDPLVRPKVVEVEGDRSRAEGLLLSLSASELLEMLEKAVEVA